ncbi:hypothetical protein D1872_259090 [compost metagenome]
MQDVYAILVADLVVMPAPASMGLETVWEADWPVTSSRFAPATHNYRSGSPCADGSIRLGHGPSVSPLLLERCRIRSQDTYPDVPTALLAYASRPAHPPTASLFPTCGKEQPFP